MQVTEEYHIIDEATGSLTVCDSEQTAMQYLSTLLPGMVVTMKKVSIAYHDINIHGTKHHPLPAPPSQQLPITSSSVTYTYIQSALPRPTKHNGFAG